MTVAPLRRPGANAGGSLGGPRGPRLQSGGMGRARESVSPGRIARRRLVVSSTKYLLPVLALALLTSVAMWPELNRAAEQGRLALRRLGGEIKDAHMIDARYRGVDERNRPYTITAATATQVDPERVNLTTPKGDITLENGAWLMVQSRDGVYMQHADQLDLSHDVVLYRDDGTTLRTETATIDLRNGAAATADPVASEGPLGTLDALNGFTLVDRGDVIQFAGPSRLVMNGASP